MSDPTTPKPAPLKCFVIMPFTNTTHVKEGVEVTIVPAQWKHIYEEWVKKAVESFPDRKIVCKRSTAKPGNFIKGIVQDLNDSHLVVADLTGNRPNVYYELGIRNTLRTGTVMITQDFNALPSDLRTYYCFEYSYSDKAHEYDNVFATFESEMHEKIAAVLDSNFESDNPVSDFLGYSQYEQSREFARAKTRFIDTLLFLADCMVACGDFFKGIEEDPQFFLDDPVAYQEQYYGRFDRALVNSAVSRLLFDYERTMFPTSWLRKMEFEVTKAHQVMMRLILVSNDPPIRIEPSRSMLHEDTIAILKQLTATAIFSLVNNLNEINEPAAPRT